MKRLTACLLLLCLAGCGQAEAEEPDASPEPYAEMALDIASLHRGVEAVLAIMEDEDNDLGIVFHLNRRSATVGRKVINYKDVEVRYSKQIVTIPVYKDVYKSYETLVPRKNGSVTIMKKETRKRLVKRIKIGERKVERLVRNDKGDIVKVYRHRVYDEGEKVALPDIQKVGWIGNNAMALYVLLEAGVTPDQEPVVAKLAATLDSYLTVYGIPDFTWDVAWATAAFSRYPGDQYEFMQNRLIERLLAGQCSVKEAKGMWGALCVSADHLAKVLKEFSQLETAAENFEAVVKRKKVQNDPRIVQRRKDIERAREKIADLFLSISRAASRFVNVGKPYVIEDPNVLIGSGAGTFVPGWPYSFYQETTADMASTALAVFAFQVAHEQSKLPESCTYEHLQSLKGVPLVQPIKTNDALKRTLETLSAAADENHQWDEEITWQKTGEFLRLHDQYKGPPITVANPYETKRTPICNAHAANAIEDLVQILGEPLSDEFGPQATAARSHLSSTVAAALEKPDPMDPNVMRKVELYRSFNPIAGGLSEPYDFLYHLRLDPSKLGSDRAGQAAYGKMIAFLLANQDLDGLWKASGIQFHLVTPALRELVKHRVTRLIESWKQKGRTVTDRLPYTFIHSVLPTTWWTLSADESERLATLFALLTLNQSCGPLVSIGKSEP